MHVARAAILAIVLAACAPTLAHPMRVTPGVFAEGGGLVLVGDGRQVSCFDGCREFGGAALEPVPVPYLTIGGGTVVAGHIGLLGGITYPARSDIFGNRSDIAYEPRFWGLSTLQDRWGSIGLGLDLALSGAAFTILAEGRPGGDERWVPAIGAFWSAYLPYAARAPERVALATGGVAELDGVQPTLDVGVRLTVGWVFAQWSLTMETQGLRGYPHFEGGTLSSLRHTISLGIVVQSGS